MNTYRPFMWIDWLEKVAEGEQQPPSTPTPSSTNTVDRSQMSNVTPTLNKTYLSALDKYNDPSARIKGNDAWNAQQAHTVPGSITKARNDAANGGSYFRSLANSAKEGGYQTVGLRNFSNNATQGTQQAQGTSGTQGTQQAQGTSGTLGTQGNTSATTVSNTPTKPNGVATTPSNADSINSGKTPLQSFADKRGMNFAPKTTPAEQRTTSPSPATPAGGTPGSTTTSTTPNVAPPAGNPKPVTPTANPSPNNTATQQAPITSNISNLTGTNNKPPASMPGSASRVANMNSFRGTTTNNVNSSGTGTIRSTGTISGADARALRGGSPNNSGVYKPVSSNVSAPKQQSTGTLSGGAPGGTNIKPQALSYDKIL